MSTSPYKSHISPYIQPMSLTEEEVISQAHLYYGYKCEDRCTKYCKALKQIGIKEWHLFFTIGSSISPGFVFGGNNSRFQRFNKVAAQISFHEFSSCIDRDKYEVLVASIFLYLQEVIGLGTCEVQSLTITFRENRYYQQTHGEPLSSVSTLLPLGSMNPCDVLPLELWWLTACCSKFGIYDYPTVAYEICKNHMTLSSTSNFLDFLGKQKHSLRISNATEDDISFYSIFIRSILEHRCFHCPGVYLGLLSSWRINYLEIHEKIP